MPGERKSKMQPPPGSAYTNTDGELTLLGEESSDQLSHRQLVVQRNQRQRHRVQDRTLSGLNVLLVETLVLGETALIGVAAGWLPEAFALQALAATLGPSFTAWIVVVQWAFRRGRRG